MMQASCCLSRPQSDLIEGALATLASALENLLAGYRFHHHEVPCDGTGIDELFPRRKRSALIKALQLHPDVPEFKQVYNQLPGWARGIPASQLELQALNIRLWIQNHGYDKCGRGPPPASPIPAIAHALRSIQNSRGHIGVNAKCPLCSHCKELTVCGPAGKQVEKNQ